ncbi:MAG: flagellar basal body rod C-terminal domain-containing protein [Rickettsiales bacterium]
MQTIIDEINNHFFPPPVKAEVNNFNNIQLVSDTNTLPVVPGPSTFSFDFDIDNISAENGDFYVTGVTVLDNTGANITNVTSTRPQVALSATNTYSTSLGSNVVTVSAPGHTFKVGDTVYLSDPGVAVGGISNTSLSGYFEITSATNNSFTINANTTATAAATGSVANMTATPPWDTINAGEKTRVRDAGLITADLSGNVSSPYYDITVDVGVRAEGDPKGQVTTTTITYRIFNGETNLLNDRYNNTAMTGSGNRVVGQSPQPYLRALMVDANGVELPSTNGIYTGAEGYLKLETYDPKNTVAINEMDSKQLGVVNYVARPEAGTNRHFSHYFELNNLFKSNDPTATGDTVKGSAYSFDIEDRFLNNANLISLGKMVQSNQSADPNDPPQYTYQRYSGDNSAIQSLAKVGVQNYTFAAAGGLDDTTITFDGYVGEILGYQSSKSTQSEATLKDSQILQDGFDERLNNMKGVNVDEEMANTIIYQNAYQASARIITVTSQLFDALLQSVGP